MASFPGLIDLIRGLAPGPGGRDDDDDDDNDNKNTKPKSTRANMMRQIKDLGLDVKSRKATAEDDDDDE